MEEPLPPGPSLEELSVVVSTEEQCASRLSEDTLRDVVRTLDTHGVVRLQRAWAADSEIVDPVAQALHANYESLAAKLAAKGITANESFAYQQIIHRSLGRYDMSLEEHMNLGTTIPASDDEEAAESIGIQIIQFLLAAPIWKQILTAVIGADYKINFTAALHARPGALEQKPHMDGGHLFHSTHGSMYQAPLHALQMFLPMCVTPVDRGPTEFWPGTHLASTGASPAMAPLLPSVAMECTPGDAIIFDFRVMHRGMANRSSKWRPVLYQTCSRNWFTDDFNFPELSIDAAEDDGKVPVHESGGPGRRSGFVRRS